ncbi:hypothetical protein HYH02_013015 [Chlamydomonas schloesseri]|uniref:C3H1-type domain-containing protein n=1 Tax=Chlamydomonas schloesseri TaxID=2026947 RepID=A0A835SS19_9CHLO|nr:hypothetical protein HYH02_013015 [Chlamydomonas schloesseri]|eukprot:KAG2432292.1 hypothetical protein HYH02_013015 [Chlamydomonas schloesseri]
MGDRYKTMLCVNFEGGSCKFGAHCQFAHGAHELRSRRIQDQAPELQPPLQPPRGSQQHKTQLCKWHQLGSCSFGARCKFAHGEEELRSTGGGGGGGSGSDAPSGSGLPVTAPPPPPPPPPLTPADIQKLYKELLTSARAGDTIKTSVKSRELLERGPKPHYGLSRNQAADLIAAATMQYPCMPNLTSLLPLAVGFGDWTLLERQYPSSSQQGSSQAVYCQLLHETALTLLEWNKAGCSGAATAGLDVLRAICTARPSAVVDMKAPGILSTPLETVLLAGHEPRGVVGRVLREVAPITWLHTAPGHAAHRRAVEVCEALAGDEGCLVARNLGLGEAYFLACASVLQGMYDKKPPESVYSEAVQEPVPPPGSGHIQLPPLEIPGIPRVFTGVRLGASSNSSSSAGGGAAQAQAQAQGQASAPVASTKGSAKQPHTQQHQSPSGARSGTSSSASSVHKGPVAAAAKAIAAKAAAFAALGQQRQGQQQQGSVDDEVDDEGPPALLDDDSSDEGYDSEEEADTKLGLQGMSGASKAKTGAASQSGLARGFLGASGGGSSAKGPAAPVAAAAKGAAAAAAAASAATAQQPKQQPAKQAQASSTTGGLARGFLSGAASTSAGAAAGGGAALAKGSAAQAATSAAAGAGPGAKPATAAKPAASATAPKPAAATAAAAAAAKPAPVATNPAAPLAPPPGAAQFKAVLSELEQAVTSNSPRQVASCVAKLNSDTGLRQAFTPPPGVLFPLQDKAWAAVKVIKEKALSLESPLTILDDPFWVAQQAARAAASSSAQAGLLQQLLDTLRKCVWKAALEHKSSAMVLELRNVKMPEPGSLPWWLETLRDAAVPEDRPSPSLLEALLDTGNKAAAAVASDLVEKYSYVLHYANRNPCCLGMVRGLPVHDVDYHLRASLSVRTQKGGAKAEAFTAELQLPDPAAPEGWRRREVTATAFGWWALLPHYQNDHVLLSSLLKYVDPKLGRPAFEGLPPLHVLIQYGRRPWNGVKTVAKDPRLNALLMYTEGLLEQVAGGITPLYRAVCVGDVDVIVELINRGANPLASCTDARAGGSQDTPLHAAICRKSVEALEAIIGHSRPDVIRRLDQAYDSDGACPLMLAAEVGFARGVDILMTAAADPTLLHELAAGKAKKKTGSANADGPGACRQSVLSRVLQLVDAEAERRRKQGSGGEEAADGAKKTSAHESVMEAIHKRWRVEYSGTALHSSLGAEACKRVRAWLLGNAAETLWPIIQAMGAGGVRAGVLTASLMELLLEVCREAGGPDWRVPGTNDPFKLPADTSSSNSGNSNGGTWAGPSGTCPPQQMPVWTLIPESPVAQVEHARATAAAASQGTSLPPAWLTVPMMREMLQRGLASPHERVQPYRIMSELCKGSTLLHKACFIGDIEMVRLLLEAGADWAAKDDNGNTALHYAAMGSSSYTEEHVMALCRLLMWGRQEGVAAPGGGNKGSAAAAAALPPLLVEPERLALATATNSNKRLPEDLASAKIKPVLKKEVQALKQRVNAKLKNQEAAAKAGGGKAAASGGGKAEDKAAKGAAAEQPAADSKAGNEAAAAAAPAAPAPVAPLVLSPAEQLKALLADDEVLAAAPLAQLVGVPEESALQLATRLAKALPGTLLRGRRAGMQGSSGNNAGGGEGGEDGLTRLRAVVEGLREDDDEEGQDPDEGAEYSEDDTPPPGEELLDDDDVAVRGAAAAGAGDASPTAAAGSSSNGAAAANGVAAQADAPDFDNHPLRNLAWPLLITKEAIAGWGTLNDQWRKLVMARLRVIGQGLWPRCRGAKRITSDDALLMPQELWRLKLTKGGRILFEVAVDDHDSKGTFCEIIRVWCITLNHKEYEVMIQRVQRSFTNSLRMRLRKKLQPLELEGPGAVAAASGGAGAKKATGGAKAAAAAAVVAGGDRTRTRLPRFYKEAGLVDGGAAGEEGRVQEQGKALVLREHYPPASWADDTYTTLKFYTVDGLLVKAVMSGLAEAQVDFMFKLSPQERDLITMVPSPPSSIILLGRSGTGKTTCAVFRLWTAWLAPYLSRAHEPPHAVFVTASATLREQVARAFRKLQRAALRDHEWERASAAFSATYHTFKDVPPEAFPLFLSSRTYLRMLDGTTERPFFPRAANGAIIQVAGDGDEADPDGAALVVALNEDLSDEEDEEDTAAADEERQRGPGAADGGEEGGAALFEEEVAAADAARREEAARARLLLDMEGAAAGAVADGYGLGVAGRARLNREVTYQHFVSAMWPSITTPEQRAQVAPGRVYQEIVSYIKGSAEAISSPDGHLSREQYMALGRKRAANFSAEMRGDVVWPIFEKYERLKRQEWRYDMLDLVGHIYREMTTTPGGYAGTPVHALYRDEVQDFTQGELLLDMVVAADPNSLFYCGDTAQTIARGIGFRFADTRTLFHEENTRRQEAAARRLAAEAAAAESVGKAVARRGHGMTIATPPVLQLTMNYRTHQGVLDVAAVVVEALRRFFPLQIDKLERESAQFPGPHPLLLGSISADDLTYLLSGSDKKTSQVEFGAHQVILVRSMAAVDQLPEEIRDSNAIIMTVPQAKGLEFDDVFLVDFFADSQATAEWRVLCSYLKELQERGGKGLDGYAYALQQVAPADPGAVRPLEFNEGAHVVLAEELKHLYTAITRAKNNVVIFDRNAAKRAPFYHLLQSLGMARTVHKSLLEDGADAAKFGLTQKATSSRHEWAKRARNLMGNRNYAMARKAFLQAEDQVRAEVAEAFLKRQRAGQESIPDADKRRLLASAALQLLAATTRCGESPDPAEPEELRRWVREASKFLEGCGKSIEAAQLKFKLGTQRAVQAALRLLVDAKEHAAAADCCLHMAAAELAAARARAVEEDAAAAGSMARLMMTEAELAAQREAQAHQAAVPWLAKAVEQFQFASNSAAVLALLAPPGFGQQAPSERSGAGASSTPAAAAVPGSDSEADEDGGEDEAEDVAEDEEQQRELEAQERRGPLAAFAPMAPRLHAMLARRWQGYGQALRAAAIALHSRGSLRRAGAVARLVPIPHERDTLLETLGYWRARARARSAADPLGAAQVLLEHGDTRRAVRLVLRCLEPLPAASGAEAAEAAMAGAGGLTKAARQQQLYELQLRQDHERRQKQLLEANALVVLQRILAAQSKADEATKLRRVLEAWMDKQAKPEEDAKEASAEAASLNKRLLPVRGQVLLLEGRLLLEPWVAAVATGTVGPPGTAAAEDGTVATATTSAAAREAAWREAMPLLLTAVECFLRCDQWAEFMEAASLLLRSAPEAATGASMATGQLAEVEQALLQVMQAAAAPASDSEAPAAAAASCTQAAKQALARSMVVPEGALKLVRTAQTACDALGVGLGSHASGGVSLRPGGGLIGRASGFDRTRTAASLSKPQQDTLAALEGLLGLPGLSRPAEGKLPARSASHSWWAALGQHNTEAVRRAAATKATVGSGAKESATDAKEKDKKPATSWAAMAAKGAASSVSAAARDPDVSMLASTSQLLARCHLAAAAEADVGAMTAAAEAPGAGAGQLALPRATVAAVAVRALAVRAACLAHLAAGGALAAYLRPQAAADAKAAGAGTQQAQAADAAAAPQRSELVLDRLRPLVCAARAVHLAKMMIGSVAQGFSLAAAPSLRRCLDAQLRRVAAALVSASLPPATTPELLRELLQPPSQPQRRPGGGGGGPSRKVMGELLELLPREGFPYRQLSDWADEQLVRCMPLEYRMPLAPAVSYLACRTLMLVAPDSEDRAARLFALKDGGAKTADLPPQRLVHEGKATGPAEALLVRAFRAIDSCPVRAVGDLLYYLAWCARRDGLAAAAPGGAAAESAQPSAAAAGGKSSGGAPSTPEPVGLALPLEAYAELLEVTVGQLLLAACDNALLPGSLAGTLAGLPRVSDPHSGLDGVADTWARELGLRGLAAGVGAGGGGGAWGPGRGRGPSPAEVAQAKARAAEARKELTGQLRLAARLTLVMASHIDQRLQDAAASAAGGPGGDAASGGGAPELELLQQEVLPLLDAPGRRDALELLKQPGGPGAQLRRPQGKGRSGGAGVGGSSCASVAAPSAGASLPRLRAVAQRVLLAAGAALVSLELQESIDKPKRQQQKAAAEKQRLGGGPVPELLPLRLADSTEAAVVFRDACTLLQARVAPACFQPPTGPTDMASVAQAADGLAKLSQRVCYPGSRLSTGMRLVSPDADREYEGLSGAKPPKGPLALLFQAAQAKMQLPKAAADAGIGGRVQAASAAVAGVAARDYQATEDERTRQRSAALVIQKHWRAWRQARAERAEAARRERQQVQALQVLRTSIRFRLWVRARCRMARNALDAQQYQERFAAGCSAVTQFGDQELRFVATESVLKEKFVQLDKCPVCSRDVLEQQREELRQQLTQRQAGKLKGGAAEFRPHKNTVEHLEAANAFAAFRQVFASDLPARLGGSAARMDQLRASLERMDAFGVSGGEWQPGKVGYAPVKGQVLAEAKQALHGAEQARGAVEAALRQLAADRAWEQLNGGLLFPRYFALDQALQFVDYVRGRAEGLTAAARLTALLPPSEQLEALQPKQLPKPQEQEQAQPQVQEQEQEQQQLQERARTVSGELPEQALPPALDGPAAGADVTAAYAAGACAASPIKQREPEADALPVTPVGHRQQSGQWAAQQQQQQQQPVLHFTPPMPPMPTALLQQLQHLKQGQGPSGSGVAQPGISGHTFSQHNDQQQASQAYKHNPAQHGQGGAGADLPPGLAQPSGYAAAVAMGGAPGYATPGLIPPNFAAPSGFVRPHQHLSHQPYMMQQQSPYMMQQQSPYMMQQQSPYMVRQQSPYMMQQQSPYIQQQAFMPPSPGMAAPLLSPAGAASLMPQQYGIGYFQGGGASGAAAAAAGTQFGPMGGQGGSGAAGGYGPPPGEPGTDSILRDALMEDDEEDDDEWQQTQRGRRGGRGRGGRGRGGGAQGRGGPNGPPTRGAGGGGGGQGIRGGGYGGGGRGGNVYEALRGANATPSKAAQRRGWN